MGEVIPFPSRPTSPEEGEPATDGAPDSAPLVPHVENPGEAPQKPEDPGDDVFDVPVPLMF